MWTSGFRRGRFFEDGLHHRRHGFVLIIEGMHVNRVYFYAFVVNCSAAFHVCVYMFLLYVQ